MIALPCARVIKRMDQEILLIEVSKSPLSMGKTCDSLAKGPRHPIQDASAQQKTAILCRETSKKLFTDILQEKWMRARFGLQQSGGLCLTSQRQGKQLDADNPATGMLLKSVLQIRRQVK